MKPSRMINMLSHLLYIIIRSINNCIFNISPGKYTTD